MELQSGIRADTVHDKTWGAKGQTSVVERAGQRQSVNAASAVSARVGFWVYLQVEDVDDVYEWIRGSGVETLDASNDQPWRMREFNLSDLNGYRLRFGAADIHSGESLPVVRVPLNARIEKRLAALLQDLADHKKMTVGEVLEETLLHSFETTPSMAGRWVASPHTARNLRYVEKLMASITIRTTAIAFRRKSTDKGVFSNAAFRSKAPVLRLKGQQTQFVCRSLPPLPINLPNQIHLQDQHGTRARS